MRALAEQVDLATITKVVLTHLHFDHAGGAALLPDSVPVFVQRREWEAGHDSAAIEKNFFLPRDYEAIEHQVDARRRRPRPARRRLGSAAAHARPHARPPVGAGRRRLVLGGDVVHYASVLDDHRFPIIGDDLDAQAASASGCGRCATPESTVTPGHDPALLASLDLSPGC